MKFEIETQYTLEEYKKFNKAVINVIYNGRRERNIVIVVYAMVIAGFISLKMYGSAVVAFLIFPAATYLVLKSRDKQIKAAWETNALMKDAIYHYKFSEDRVEASSPKGVEILEYDKMYKLIEIDTHFYMMLAQNVGFIVPKEKLSEEQQNFIRSLDKK